MNSLTKSETWKALQAQQRALEKTPLLALFAENPNRFQQFSFQFHDILIDFSKQFIRENVLTLLLQLANERDLATWIQKLFSGEKINFTEKRAALHTALRKFDDKPLILDGRDIMQDVKSMLMRMNIFVEAVRSGTWRGFSGEKITDVVNIGVGGSNLGPQMATEALRPYADGPRIHFVSCIDGEQAVDLLTQLNPATTLFIVVSKTFTTLDTLSNAKTARNWFQNVIDQQDAWQHHFIGISANSERMTEFGILPNNQFLFWDWVGGRFSVWSSVGLTIALAIGMQRFKEFLTGAYKVDQHFMETPLSQNIPVLMGLLTVWYSNFWKASNKVILPYDSRLALFPSYLQQLEMESCGKHVTITGEAINYKTGQVIWGRVGPNAQHTFYQLLHQGTQLIPADFIVPIKTAHDLPQHRYLALANALAQSRALMLGRQDSGLPAYRQYPGNRPSTMIIFPKLTPEILGSLIALYGQKVFVQSVIWGINPFDQWGVEYGKELAKEIFGLLTERDTTKDLDPSTHGLLEFIYDGYGN